MSKNDGITLIALVVTIVVLLILAGTSIAMLSGDNGIITQAQEAKLETRGGDVEERVNLWKTEHELKEYSEMQVLGESEFIEDLKSKNLVFDDEINTETKIITIGSREIYYGLKDPVRIIKFKIGETEYEAEDGMTWAEWIETDYNTKGFYVDNYNEVQQCMNSTECRFINNTIINFK